MAPHSSTLAWQIPWTEEPGGLQSKGSLGVWHDWANFTLTCHFHALEKEMATHSSVLAWRIPGTGASYGLPSQGSHRVGHDWSDLAAAVKNLVSPERSLFILSHPCTTGLVLGRYQSFTLLHSPCFPLLLLSQNLSYPHIKTHHLSWYSDLCHHILHCHCDSSLSLIPAHISCGYWLCFPPSWVNCDQVQFHVHGISSLSTT